MLSSDKIYKIEKKNGYSTKRIGYIYIRGYHNETNELHAFLVIEKFNDVLKENLLSCSINTRGEVYFDFSNAKFNSLVDTTGGYSISRYLRFQEMILGLIHIADELLVSFNSSEYIVDDISFMNILSTKVKINDVPVNFRISSSKW